MAPPVATNPKVYCSQCKWFAVDNTATSRTNADEICTEKSNLINKDNYKTTVVMYNMIPSDLNANNDCKNYAGVK